MTDNPTTLEPGTYEIQLSDCDDVKRISVTTSVVPKPPPRIYVEVKVERKQPAAD